MARVKASAARSGSSPSGRRADDLLGRRIGADASPTRLTLQAVYDGRRCIGHLLSRGKLGIEAYDAETRSLGIFPHQKSAPDTISRKELWR